MLADYVSPISGAALQAAGVKGVLRYIAKEHGSTIVVGVTAGEVADLATHGIDLGLIYEDSSATWMAGGYSAGVQAGQWIRQQCVAAGVMPRCVYLAADSPSLSSVAVNACLDGAASVLGRPAVGLYGFRPNLQAAQAGGHASWYWLCGHYQIAPWMHLYQANGSQPSGPTTISVAGETCDVDIPLQSDWGQNTGADVNLTDNVCTLKDGRPINVQEALAFLVQWAIDGGPDAPNGKPGNVVLAEADELSIGFWQGGPSTLNKAPLATLIGQAATAATAADSDAKAATVLAAQADADVKLGTTAVVAAIKGVQAGQVDVNALAAALVPLLSTADAHALLVALEGVLPKS